MKRSYEAHCRRYQLTAAEIDAVERAADRYVARTVRELKDGATERHETADDVIRAHTDDAHRQRMLLIAALKLGEEWIAQGRRGRVPPIVPRPRPPRPRQPKRWAKLEIIEGLRRLAIEVGHTPTNAEMQACPYLPSPSTIAMRFESMAKAQRRAGLRPNTHAPSPRSLPVGFEEVA